MPNAASELEQFLESLARDARPGDRVPTIRDLMRRFGASQVLVQRAFTSLKSRGLIASQVGRGTYFRAEGSSPIPGMEGAGAENRAPAVRSVLLLRRSISVVRGRVLVEGLQRRFAADGHRVIEVSYTDPDHARTVLKGLPHFDACVVQSTFKTITIELLAALREKSDVLAVDGVALVGADVEAVGMEWGEPLAVALAQLQQRGHRRIAFATTAHPFLANELGRRRFGQLMQAPGGSELSAITVPQLPDGDYSAALVDALKAQLDSSGRLPFTALIAWGIEDGAKFRSMLSSMGLDVPSALSVVLLGRTDLVNEHADFFDIVGCRVADQSDYLHRAVTEHLADPSLPYGVRLIPVASRPGQSVDSPAADGAPVRRTVSTAIAADSPT